MPVVKKNFAIATLALSSWMLVAVSGCAESTPPVTAAPAPANLPKMDEGQRAKLNQAWLDLKRARLEQHSKRAPSASELSRAAAEVQIAATGVPSARAP